MIQIHVPVWGYEEVISLAYFVQDELYNFFRGL